MSGDRPKCDCPPGALSASQIDTYRSCPRKWGFRKLARQPEPEFGFQVAGKSIHDMLETYELTGLLPDRNAKYGKAVWNVVDHLPSFNPRHRCEEHIRIDCDGMTIHGYPDLLPCGAPEVHDYKTVSTQSPPFKFAHTPPTLKKDTQANVYAWARTDGRDPITLKWHYIERNKPHRARTVQAVLTYDDLAENMSSIWDVAADMYGHKDACEGYTKPIDYVNDHLAANTDFCDAYGGCPHAAYCTANSTARHAPLGEDIMTGFEKLRNNLAQMGSQGGTAAAPSRTKQPDPVNPPREDVPDEDDEEDPEQTELERQQKRIQKEIRELEEKRAQKAAAKAAKAERASRPASQESETVSGAGYETRHCGDTFTVTVKGSGDSLEAAIHALKSAIAAM